MMKIYNENLRLIVLHLEFLGYKNQITQREESGKETVSMWHNYNSNMVIHEMDSGFIIFIIFLEPKRKFNEAVLLFTNLLNIHFKITKAISEVDDGVVQLKLEAVYIGQYEKKSFSQFISLFIEEQRDLLNFNEYKNLFKQPTALEIVREIIN